MKRALLLLTLAASLDAHAMWLDPSLRVCIKEACLTKVGGAHAEAFCGCLGTRHFRSAKRMPDVHRATRDLGWVISYYRAHDAATIHRLRAEPDNLVAYNAMLVEQCAPKAMKRR